MVLGLHKVGKRLGLLVAVVVVVVAVAVVLGSDIVHLVHVAALGAPVNRALARETDPDNIVRVDGEARAAGVLLVTGRADQNGVLDSALARGIQGPHVKHVNILHLAENLETLDTGRLLEVRGDSAGLGTGAEKVVGGLDICGRGGSVMLDIKSLHSRAYIGFCFGE